MNTDLTEIQNLWQAINEHIIIRTKEESNTAQQQPNIVFVLQKELAFSGDARVSHYFLGKARFFEITPFSPDDLMNAYRAEFGSLYPFEEKDLLYVARMSRGIFRRFLRYIQLCLEQHIQKAGTGAYKDLVNKETVETALSIEEIAKDWEIELRQIFPHGSNWKHALTILKVLAEGARVAVRAVRVHPGIRWQKWQILREHWRNGGFEDCEETGRIRLRAARPDWHGQARPPEPIIQLILI